MLICNLYHILCDDQMYVAVLGFKDRCVKELDRTDGFRIRRVLFGIADDRVIRHRHGKQQGQLFVIHAVMRDLQHLAGEILPTEHQRADLRFLGVARKEIRFAVDHDLGHDRLVVVVLAVVGNGGRPKLDAQIAVFLRFVLAEPDDFGARFRKRVVQLLKLLGLFLFIRGHNDAVDRNFFNDLVRAADVILVEMREDEKIELFHTAVCKPVDDIISTQFKNLLIS